MALKKEGKTMLTFVSRKGEVYITEKERRRKKKFLHVPRNPSQNAANFFLLNFLVNPNQFKDISSDIYEQTTCI